jgi:hypothetical protein
MLSSVAANSITAIRVSLVARRGWGMQGYKGRKEGGEKSHAV